MTSWSFLAFVQFSSAFLAAPLSVQNSHVDRAPNLRLRKWSSTEDLAAHEREGRNASSPWSTAGWKVLAVLLFIRATARPLRRTHRHERVVRDRPTTESILLQIGGLRETAGRVAPVEPTADGWRSDTTRTHAMLFVGGAPVAGPLRRPRSSSCRLSGSPLPSPFGPTPARTWVEVSIAMWAAAAVLGPLCDGCHSRHDVAESGRLRPSGAAS